MKNLLSVLPMGMLLAALIGSARTTTINLDEQFTKLCGRDFVTKVVNVCRGINWKDLLPRLDDPSQASGDDDIVKDMMKTQMLPGNGTHDPDTDNGEQGLHQDLSQSEEMPDDVHGFVTQTPGDHGALLGLEETFIHPKLTKRQISTNDRCCKSSCTLRQIRRLCFQTK